MKRTLFLVILFVTFVGFLFFLPIKKHSSLPELDISSKKMPSSFKRALIQEKSDSNFLNQSTGVNEEPDSFGEDTNKNGLWDDVEESILDLGHTLEQEKALAFTLRTYQRAIEHPEDGTLIKEEKIKNYTMQSIECRLQIFGTDELAPDPEEIAKLISNNSKRTKQYLKFMNNLSGSMLSLWNEEKDGKPCPF